MNPLHGTLAALAFLIAPLLPFPAGAQGFPSRLMLWADRTEARVASPVMNVTFTANVSGQPNGIPTGVVHIQGVCNITLVGGAGTCNVPPPRDITFVTGTYLGDETFAQSDWVSVPLTTFFPSDPMETRGVLGTPGYTLAGDPAGLTLTVTPRYSSNGTPLGFADFRDDGISIPGCNNVALVAVEPDVGRATCTLSSLAMRTHSITAWYSGDAGKYSQRDSFDPVYKADWTPNVLHPVYGSTNVALASAGATAAASTTLGAPVSSIAAVIDGDRQALAWGNGAGWEDNSFDSYPDWVEIGFNARRTIDSVVVYSLRDDYTNPVASFDGLTFTLYGVVDFSVQGWTGSAWSTLATVAGNDLVQRIVSFEPFATDRMRVVVTRGSQFKSRIVEVEAWGAPAAANPTNVAHARAGAIARASSNYGSPFSSIAAAIDGDRMGASWGAGGGWQDATYDAYPDWFEVVFAGAKTIDRVVVYSLRDDYAAARLPLHNGLAELHHYGLRDFRIDGWTGSAWQTLATVANNVSEARTVSFAAFTTNRVRLVVTQAMMFSSRVVELEAWGVPSDTPFPTNVAAAAEGATAAASSDYGAPFSSVAALIDSEATGFAWGAGGGWEDATFGAWPDWVQVDFSGAKTIDRVVVYSLRDGYGHAVVPDDFTTFNYYGITDFSVQGWDGTAWVTLASVAGNDLARRSVAFEAFTTDRIRVVVNGALYYKSRIVEIEAWGLPAPGARANVARASLGAVASASSDRGGPISAVARVNDGDFVGASWGNLGGWEDATWNAFPDWVQVDFGATRTIEQVVVFSLRDDYAHHAAPTDATTFTRYGLVDFAVQGWNGSAWTTLGTVSGNDRVMRAVSFAPFTTERIRVNVTSAQYFKSRVVEVQAWGN